MNKLFIIIDQQSGDSVTTMPTHSKCQAVIRRLPRRAGYSIHEVPMKTLHLSTAFLSHLTGNEAAEYYETVNQPDDSPFEWYGSPVASDSAPE